MKFPKKPDENVRKIGLISHDYWKKDDSGLCGFATNAAAINEQCDKEQCDTKLYSLFTWDHQSPVPRNRNSFFANLQNVQRLILEVADCSNEDATGRQVEVWRRDQDQPILMHQMFSESGERGAAGKQFIDDLPNRRVANALIIICGESGIVKERRSGGFDDPFQFTNKLQEMGVSLILNPLHDYMPPSHGVNMQSKRCYYSRDKRTVVSVWNKGKRRWDKKKRQWCKSVSEPEIPWSVFQNGAPRPEAVQPLPSPIAKRPDIMIGILSLDSILS